MNSLSNRLPLLIYALPALLAVLVAGSIVRLATASQQVPKQADVFLKIRGTINQPGGDVSMDDYVAIRPGCFFRPPEMPAPVARSEEAPRRPEPTGMRAVYVLRGVVAHSNPEHSRVFIEIPGVSEQRAYGRGDNVHGAEILSIEHEAVHLRRGEEDITLTVRFEDESMHGRLRSGPPTTYSRRADGRAASGRPTTSRFPDRRSLTLRRSSSGMSGVGGASVGGAQVGGTAGRETSPEEQERIRRAYEKQREKELKREAAKAREVEDRREREQRNQERDQERERLRNMSKEERVQYLRSRKLEKKGREKGRR